MLPHSWMSSTPPVSQPTTARIVVKYQEKKFIVSLSTALQLLESDDKYLQVVVSNSATFRDVKAETVRVYRSISHSHSNEQ